MIAAMPSTGSWSYSTVRPTVGFTASPLVVRFGSLHSSLLHLKLKVRTRPTQTRNLTVSARSVIKFQVGNVASKVSGILRLVQVFLKMLLTTPGQDIFAPRVGGNALKNIGQTFGKDQGGTIVSDIIVSVDTTRKQIIALQSRDPTIPRDERLLAATVTAAAYNQAEGALVVTLELTSQAGRSATANIMV